MGRVDGLVLRVRAWIDAKSPWYDVEREAQRHADARRAIANAEAVLGRTDVMRGSYMRAGKRLGR